MAPRKRISKAHSTHPSKHAVLSQPEIKYIIKSTIKVAKRHKFGSTKFFKKRHYKMITKKMNAKFAPRPEPTSKMVMCVFDNARDNGQASENAHLEAKAESEKEEMRKAEEHAVCEKLEGIVLDGDESSNEDYGMQLDHEEEEDTAGAIGNYHER
ncbi:MAG: hypothetical protein ASARMPRED_003694 [Alectoria sarmentosa]|nr:MAG: hypothetical protein ASARMPRED_003694 [Alectoria sarmentosa]